MAYRYTKENSPHLTAWQRHTLNTNTFVFVYGYALLVNAIFWGGFYLLSRYVR